MKQNFLPFQNSPSIVYIHVWGFVHFGLTVRFKSDQSPNSPNQFNTKNMKISLKRKDWNLIT